MPPAASAAVLVLEWSTAKAASAFPTSLLGRRKMSVFGLLVERAYRVIVQVHNGPVESS